MFHGVTTLMQRSIREAATRRRHHLMRLGTALFLLVLLVSAHVSTRAAGAPGLYYFSLVTTLDLVLIVLAATGLFAPCIVEEREQGVLPLLLLAGVDPLSIILGKSGGRLFVCLSLLAVQIPFGVLAAALGGLLVKQIVVAYAILVAFLLLAAAWGTAMSAVASRPTTASLLTAGGLLLLLTSSQILTTSARGFVMAGWLKPGSSAQGWLSQTAQRLHAQNPYVVLRQVLQGPDSSADWPTAVLLYLVLAAALWLGSWAILRKDVYGMGWRGGRRARPPAAVSDAARCIERAAKAIWRFPVAWKEFHQLGGWPLVTIKSLVYVLLFVAFRWEMSFLDPRTRGGLDYWKLMFTLISGLLVWEWLLYASRLFGDEFRTGGWDLTSALPMSLPRLAAEKLLGCLCLSTPTLLAWAFAARNVTVRWAQLLADPECLALIFAGVVFWHLVLASSLFVRNGSLVLSVAVVTLAGVLLFPFLAAAASAFSVSGTRFESMSAVLYCGISLTALLQFCIWTRLRQLAER